LAIQYAKAMGFVVAALSTSEDKRELATKLGAAHYIVGKADEQAKKLQELGGAKLIVVTAPSAKAVSPLLNGLAVQGTLLILGAQEEPIPFDTVLMLTKGLRVKGHPSGGPRDSEDAIKFALAHGVKSMNNVFDFKDAQKAYDGMMVRSRPPLLLADFSRRAESHASVTSSRCEVDQHLHGRVPDVWPVDCKVGLQV
jgi:propanol-preferring alcohol dehydrogenase